MPIMIMIMDIMTMIDIQGKQFVVLTGRVHPGESPSSWMMRGVIQFLTGNCHLDRRDCDNCDDDDAVEGLRDTLI